MEMTSPTVVSWAGKALAIHSDFVWSFSCIACFKSVLARSNPNQRHVLVDSIAIVPLPLSN
eukprot:2813102-Amphidinium_carterae.1